MRLIPHTLEYPQGGRMIPAPPRLVARSKYTMEGPKGAHIYFEECRVYACDDDGTPMIVSQESASGLVRATQRNNYRGLESAEDVPTLLAEVERLTKELARSEERRVGKECRSREDWRW